MPEHVTVHQSEERFVTLATTGRARLYEVRVDGTVRQAGPVENEPAPGALTSGKVWAALSDYAHTLPVAATTPHGSYTFDVLAVEDRDGVPVLRLQERTDA